MKILVTGGVGYIGSHTAVELVLAGHEVVLYDNLTNSNSSVVDAIEKIVEKKISLIEGDVRDTNLLINCFKQFEINAVMHFAGLKAVGDSVINPIEYFSNNVQGAISLLQAMQEVGIKKLVFSSSATVYGEPKYLPVDEMHSLSVTNPYGRTKLHIEEMLSDVVKSDPDWGVVCLRYFNPVGAHVSGLIGESTKGVVNNLMPYIVQVASGEKPNLNIFGSDYSTLDGTGVRDYLHITDLAQGHLAALKYLNNNKGWHAFNLGTGIGYSVLQVVEAFSKVSGKSIPYALCPRREGDVPQCYADPTKSNQLLAWFASQNIHAMCESAWNYQTKTPSQ